MTGNAMTTSVTGLLQNVSGTLKTKSGTTKISEGKLRGDQITFTTGNAQYTGRVNGDKIEGTTKSGGKETAWQATR